MPYVSRCRILVRPAPSRSPTTSARSGARGQERYAAYLDFDVADVNNDYLLDVVAVDANHTIRIFLGNAAAPGALLPSVVVPDSVGRDHGTSISIGDVNDDGAVDIVIGSYVAEVYLQDPGASMPPDGQGWFLYAYWTFGVESYAYFAGQTKIVDFDGDGRNDLVYDDPAQGTMLLRGH